MLQAQWFTVADSLLLTACCGVQGVGACQLCVVWRCVPLEAGQLPPLDPGRLNLPCSLHLALCRTRGSALSRLMLSCLICLRSQLWSKVAELVGKALGVKLLADVCFTVH